MTSEKTLYGTTLGMVGRRLLLRHSAWSARVVTMLAAVLAAYGAYAETVVWNGTAGNGSLSDGGNWEGGSATLQLNAGKKIFGTGTISLAAGTTLALPANSDRTFTTPDIVPVTLPEEGTATIKIDGGKLRNNVDYLLLKSVPAGYADYLAITGSALDGRHYNLSDDSEEHLVLNVVFPGTVIYLR